LIPEGFFDPRQRGSPQSLLLAIDGLDEIDIERRDEFVRQLNGMGRNHSIIVASRPNPCWSTFDQIEIQELRPEEAQSLVGRLTSGKIEYDCPRFRWLPRNPLLLTLAVLLPQQEVSSYAILYREFVLNRLKRTNLDGFTSAEPSVILRLFEACAADHVNLAVSAERLATQFNLLPNSLIGLERQSQAQNLLVATGIIVRDDGGLRFIHDSFRSYFRAEFLARHMSPDKSPWRSISPFREGWETIAFVLEIWMRERKAIKSALDDLIAFGEPGLRLLAQLASRAPGLPRNTIEAAVAKWMYSDDDFWDPGHINGPIQQITLMSNHYECARKALRKIAMDSWTYSEDAAYAADGLAKVGELAEARKLLISQIDNENVLCCHRVLAIDLLIENGATDEAECNSRKLALEWRKNPPDMELAWMQLAEVLHKIGKTREAVGILN
jgi:hypothetical protein